MKAPKSRVPGFGPVEIIEEDDVPQGSDAWLQLRLGIPTASNFSLLMRDGDSKTRDLYMRTLAGEVLTGQVGEAKKFTTAAMTRGNEMEPEARDHYARTNFGEVERVGFMRRKLPSGRYVGASPDALKEKRHSGLEIKTMAPHIMIERLLSGAAMPSEHHYQVYGTMVVGELDSVTLMLFYRGMPVAPKFEVARNEKVIKEIADAVEVFDNELHKMVSKIKAMGPR